LHPAIPRGIIAEFGKTDKTKICVYSNSIGKRVIDHIPHGHWKTTTFLAALRHDELTAPMVVDGAINGEFFLA